MGGGMEEGTAVEKGRKMVVGWAGVGEEGWCVCVVCVVCVCVCVCVCMHACACLCVRAHPRASTCPRACARARARLCVRARVRVRMTYAGGGRRGPCWGGGWRTYHAHFAAQFSAYFTLPLCLPHNCAVLESCGKRF